MAPILQVETMIGSPERSVWCREQNSDGTAHDDVGMYISQAQKRSKRNQIHKMLVGKVWSPVSARSNIDLSISKNIVQKIVFAYPSRTDMSESRGVRKSHGYKPSFP